MSTSDVVEYAKIFGTLVAFLSALASMYFARKSARNRKEEWLREKLGEYIRFTIEYPQLDSEETARSWRKNLDGVEAERYDNFCCFVFNLIERIFLTFNGDKRKMNDIFYVNEPIIRHRRWWSNNMRNEVSYDGKFVEFVNQVIKDYK
jgi:hypothetical protein